MRRILFIVGSKVKGSGFKVQGSGFWVQRFRVEIKVSVFRCQVSGDR